MSKSLITSINFRRYRRRFSKCVDLSLQHRLCQRKRIYI